MQVARRPTRAVRLVYFIQGERTKLVKIGVTDDIERRMATLRLMSPDKLTLIGVVVCKKSGGMERALHDRYAEARAHGEWFYPVPNLMAWIKKRAIPAEQGAAEVAALQPQPDDRRELAGDDLAELERMRRIRSARRLARAAAA
jgi:hypothetical protein